MAMTPPPSQGSIRDELLFAIREARARGSHVDDAIVKRELSLLVDERQAEALHTYFILNYTQAQTAQAMGISQPSVCKLLRKGAINLAARLAALTAAQVT